MPIRMTRRLLLASTAASYSRILGANDTIRLGAIGLGGRCRYLLQSLNAMPDARIVATADVYAPARNLAFGDRPIVVSHRVIEYGDYRRLLESKDVDAVVIGAPDHWHVAMTRAAVAAGKDVYCEKPITHSLDDGAALVAFVEASKQIVQVGYQQRSSDVFLAGKRALDGGLLGKVTMAQAYWYQNYLARRGVYKPMETAQLDWKAWLGTAPAREFSMIRYARWRWFWDYGGGSLTDLYSHWGDTLHWYFGLHQPLKVFAQGDRVELTEFECPDTCNASWLYPGLQVTYSSTIIASLEGGGFTLRGSRAMMKITRDAVTVYPEGVIRQENSAYPDPILHEKARRDGTIDHLENWLSCIRTRKAANAPVRAAVEIASASHAANLMLRA